MRVGLGYVGAHRELVRRTDKRERKENTNLYVPNPNPRRQQNSMHQTPVQATPTRKGCGSHRGRHNLELVFNRPIQRNNVSIRHLVQDGRFGLSQLLGEIRTGIGQL